MKRTPPSASVASTNRTLRHLAFDLREVYEILDDLTAHLAGGGIVQARDIESAVAQTMPKVKRAVNALNAMNAVADEKNGNFDEDGPTSPGQSPLLI